MIILMSGGLTIAASAVVFLLITLILVGALLFAKAKLVPSGNVKLPPTYLADSNYCNISTAFNVMYDTVYFANGYIENGKIVETAYNFSATSDPKNNNYPYGLCSTGKPGLRVGPFLFSFGGDYGINGYPEKISSMHILGNYLATINNLNKPVQKTADKTMKITYILREEE